MTLTLEQRVQAVGTARRAFREIWGDEVRETHACLYMACTLQLVLGGLYGFRTMLQAGSCQWPMMRAHEDDGVKATHFSYQWEANSDATHACLLDHALPELHVWLAHRDPDTVVDTTTGSWPERAALAGFRWSSPRPPDFFWGTMADLGKLDGFELEVSYVPDLLACQVADAFGQTGPYREAMTWVRAQD